MEEQLDRFARFITMTGAVSVGLIIVAVLITGFEERALPGMILGFSGAVAGRLLLSRGRHLGMLVMLYASAVGAWLGSAAAPSAASALSAAMVYLLLASFAAIHLSSRQLAIYGAVCFAGTTSLVAYVHSLGTAVALYPGGVMAIVLVPTGFLVLGQIAVLVRTTIAQLEAAEEDARMALEARGRFLANMSHELRTPLNAIIGYSEILMEDLADREEAVDDLGSIHRSGKLLLGHIDALLDLAKLEAGRLDVYVEPVDVTMLAHEMAADQKPQFDLRGNELRLELAPGLSLATDRQKLRQILTNLLSNANKFTNGGTVTLRTRVRPDRVEFEVADTGIGITEEAMERVFQPFMQADISTTRVYGGTGLGLALVHEFSFLLGGGVTLESVHGEGTTFCVWLPFGYDGPPSRPMPSRPPSPLGG